MQSKITTRIVAQTGIPNLFPVLAEDLSPSDLQSLLLSVFRERASAINAPAVLTRAATNPVAAPSTVDARLFHQFDRAAFAAASEFEAIDLSPVCPLGTNQALGQQSQNNVLTALRNVEVLSDSTPAMAIECARRRRDHGARSAEPIRLCSSQRLIRMQPFDTPGMTPHFRLFGMVSAGRDTGSSAFEIQHLREHIDVYLRLFDILNHEGFSFATPLVEVSDLSMTEAILNAAGHCRDEVREIVRAHRPGSSERFLAGAKIELPSDIEDPAALQTLACEHNLDVQLSRLASVKQQVFDPLQAVHKSARFRFNLSRLEGLGYYPGLALRISPANPAGGRFPIADGGFTDWTARLLEDRKERVMTSGIGTEFACRAYRAAS